MYTIAQPNGPYNDQRVEKQLCRNVRLIKNNVISLGKEKLKTMNYVGTISELKLAKLFLVDTGILEEDNKLEDIIEMAEEIVRTKDGNIYEANVNEQIQEWVNLGKFL